MSETYIRIGSPRPARYGEHTKNMGLETYFTTTNLEQIGIKQHSYVLKKVNTMHWKKYGPLVKSISTCVLTYHLGVIQKLIAKARKSERKGNKQF